MTIEDFKPLDPISTPVLLLIFNRPETTSRVFEAIQKVKPPKLFIAADGPRHNKPAEKKKCDQTRAVVRNINWDCETKTLFRNENLGCRRAVSHAINWFFENVDEGIILEDDCLPSLSFFWFCEELLKKYNHDRRIMHIAGYNPHFGKQYGDASYYFSNYNLIWGWATWKRAWQYYSEDMSDYEFFLNSKTFKNIFHSKKEQLFFKDRFKQTFQEHIDSWGYLWLFSRCMQGSYAIHPNCNLIENIGITDNATHTKSTNGKFGKNPKTDITFPLTHPRFMLPDRKADSRIFTALHCKNYLRFWINKLIKRFIGY
jgi:hypothetical protein